MIIIVGRGSGGTRLMSHALAASGVYMGPRNVSGDLVPAQTMYDAVRMAGPLVQRTGDLQWDFSRLLASIPPVRFHVLVDKYLAHVTSAKGARVGWKLPETLLALPWIVRFFPDARYLYWTRAVGTSITKPHHLTDRISNFGVPSARHVDPIRSRIESWTYQRAIVEATPKPKHWLHVRFEDFVSDQEATLARVSGFLGFPVQSVTINHDSVVTDNLAGLRLRHYVPAALAALG
jgi:hypothetical protein